MKSPALLTMRRHKEQHMVPRAEDQRSTHRFRVEFRTLVSDKSGINDQVGVILDLSLSGCQVRVPILVYPTLVMELRIYAPDLDQPIFVERAVVQWVKGDTFGLYFLGLQEAELIRLGSIIARVAESASGCG
jgi:PilZ domain